MTYQIKREQRIALAIAEQFCRQWDLLPKVKRNHFRFANAGDLILSNKVSTANLPNSALG